MVTEIFFYSRRYMGFHFWKVRAIFYIVKIIADVTLCNR